MSCGCGCGKKVPAVSQYSGDTLNFMIQNSQSTPRIIFRQDLINGSVYAWLRLAYYSNPKGFMDQFAKVGVMIEPVRIEENIFTLSQLQRSGGDLRGELHNKRGEKVTFSVIDVLRSIPLDRDKIDAAKIKFQ